MKFDVITGNPTIAKQESGKYMVVYANPSENWKIIKYRNLSLEEVSNLPFVNKSVLALIK